MAYDKVNLHFVSCICGEIIATQSIEANEETLPTFKSFHDRLYGDTFPVSDDYTGSKSSLFWRFSSERFLKIKDFFTLSAFLNLAPMDRQTLFALVRDAEHFSETTKKYLEMLDLMELRDEKVRLRSKYDLKCEADVIQEQILKIQRELFVENFNKKIDQEDKQNVDILSSQEIVDKEKNPIEIPDSSRQEDIVSQNYTISTTLTKEVITCVSTEQSVKVDLRTNSLKECESYPNLKVSRSNCETDIHPDIVDEYYLEKVYRDKSSSYSIDSDASEKTVEEIIFIKPTNKNFEENSQSDSKSYSTTKSFEIEKELQVFIQKNLNDILENVVRDLDVKDESFSQQESIPDLIEPKLSVNEQLNAIFDEQLIAADEKDILLFALRKMPIGKCYTADICSGYSIIDCLKKAAMRSRIINCSPHADIYFLEADTQTHQQHHPKIEETNLESLFISPAGRELLKYKPTSKMKPQKVISNLEFFKNRTSSIRQSSSCTTNSSILTPPSESCSSCNSPSSQENSKRNSIDLYEEAASILGLTCAQTDDCRCIECQCHYLDFEESEIDFSTASEPNKSSVLGEMDSMASAEESVCCIQ